MEWHFFKLPLHDYSYGVSYDEICISWNLMIHKDDDTHSMIHKDGNKERNGHALPPGLQTNNCVPACVRACVCVCVC